MSERQVDARGLPCPRPVVMTKKALDEMDSGVLRVLVSQKVQSRNVSQVAEAAGYQAQVREAGDYFEVLITKTAEKAPATEAEEIGPARMQQGLVFMIASDRIGHGDDELGQVLMQLMMQTMAEAEGVPETIVFMNAGVRLCCKGAPVLEALRGLGERGVRLLVCGTCLQHFGLVDEVEVGEISNMYDILQTLMKAERVVNL